MPVKNQNPCLKKSRWIKKDCSGTFWRQPDLSGLEFLSAQFTTHRYRTHSHAEFVLGVVTKGCETLHCRGERHVARPGDIILVNPQSQHDGEAGTEAGWQYRVIYPSEDHLAGLIGPDSDLGRVPRFRNSVVHDPELALRITRFHRLCEGHVESIEREVKWNDILVDLVDRHGETGTSVSPRSKEIARIEQIKELLSDAPEIHHSLDELAIRVGLSPWHLIRTFKNATGVSPHAYLIDQRLKRAKSLIDRGEEVVMAAIGAGFVDQSHLSRHFLAAYGMTPGVYAGVAG